MPTAENAKIQYESGQTLVEFVALTDQGDHIDFRSADELWSNKSGYAPDIKPNGLATGGAITAGTAVDTVDVAALTCYLAGTLTTVTASAGETITRGTSSPVAPYKKSSITVTSAGAVAIVAGDPGAAFSSDRGAEGGPPYIPVDSIEIGQVWLSSADNAVITADEIKAVVGVHVERYDYPTWKVNHFNVENNVLGYAGIEFTSALPAIHSADSPVSGVPKAVYAEYYEPIFADVPKTSDFVPPETSHSISSTQIYGETLGAHSTTLNQGSFTAYLTDGISDGLLKEKGNNLFFKFFQDRLNSTPYVLCQGYFGVSRSYPANGQITAACTISAETAATEILG